jgi:transcription antitermination factor NusG
MNLSPGWWAVYTRHHHEQKVTEMLEAKGLEVFFATYRARRQWRDRIKVLPTPLFPCYVFVRERIDAKLHVVSTPGVHMIVTRGQEFALVPDEEIDAIRKASRADEHLEPCPYLKAGERIRITQGPMKGVEGVLLRRSGQYRLVLSVDLLSQSASVEVDASDIAALEAAPNSPHMETCAHWGQGSQPSNPPQATAYMKSGSETRCL